jgi:hypothetical protein
MGTAVSTSACHGGRARVTRLRPPRRNNDNRQSQTQVLLAWHDVRHKCFRTQVSAVPEGEKAALMSMLICSSPNERLHIDLYGPLKTSAAGNHYLVVMTDAFTKYVELAAIPNKTEDQVAKVLFERWFCRFSAPTVMVSDQGREFCRAGQQALRLVGRGQEEDVAVPPPDKLER